CRTLITCHFRLSRFSQAGPLTSRRPRLRQLEKGTEQGHHCLGFFEMSPGTALLEHHEPRLRALPLKLQLQLRIERAIEPAGQDQCRHRQLRESCTEVR